MGDDPYRSALGYPALFSRLTSSGPQEHEDHLMACEHDRLCMTRWMHPIRSDYRWTDTAAALNMSSMFRMLNASMTMLRHVMCRAILQPTACPLCHT